MVPVKCAVVADEEPAGFFEQLGGQSEVLAGDRTGGVERHPQVAERIGDRATEADEKRRRAGDAPYRQAPITDQPPPASSVTSVPR